jgi:chemotaxis protein methyltransferase CheR
MSGALSELAQMIQRESGMVLKPAQLPSLQDAISRVDRDLTAESLLGQMTSSETFQRLIDEITVRETFFFRHRAELDAIDWHALLAGARARGSDVVRVWVAGCASGEEAYTVLATDIAAPALEQAITGRYGKRATRTLSEEVRARYFTTEDQVVSVGERLRSLVNFRRHNLVRDPIPPVGMPLFDVLLCRNVLIYFDKPTVERVLGALERALSPNGLLLLGAADRLSGHGSVVPRRQTDTVPPRAPRALAHDGRTSPHQGDRTSQRQYSSGGRAAGRQTEPSRSSAERVAQTPRDRRQSLADALKAADHGELDLAVQIAKDTLDEDPLDSEAHFIRGSVELAREDARAALEPLRRALYIDPNFSLAAFKLARAHDALSEVEPARRAYERTLRTLDHCAAEQPPKQDRLDLLDIATACHARLRSLGEPQRRSPSQ